MFDLISRQEARLNKLNKYFDGEECSNGHISEKLTISGKCCECISEDNNFLKEQKESFVEVRISRKQKAKDGLSYIRETLNELSEIEKSFVRGSINTDEDELEILPRSRVVAQEIGEDFYNTGLPCKNNHISKRKTSSGFCCLCEKERKEEYKPYALVYVHERRSRIKNAEGSFSKSDIDLIFNNQKGLCKYCNADLKLSGYHIDHRIPLSKEGTNWPDNLQLLCPRCNLKKNSKLPEQYEKEIGYKNEQV